MKRRSTSTSKLYGLRVLILLILLTGGLLLVLPIASSTATMPQNVTGLGSTLQSRPRPTPLPRPTPAPHVDAVQQEWVAAYNGLANGEDDANAITIDSSGNVYVTGRSSRAAYPDFDYATAKYNSAGEEQWVARYNGPGNDDDEPAAIAVDDSGNVYVTGYSINSPGGVGDYATIKYNTAGQQQWVARYSSADNGASLATAIAVDTSGNVYVTGYSWTLDTDFDYVTIKYNQAGQQQWVARYNGPGNFDDEASAIVIDGTGNVYVTGGSWDAYTDYATIKYNSAGQQQWVARYGGPGNYLDDAKAIALDNFGNVYVTGSSYGLNTQSDYATVKYNSVGQQQWVARYDGQGHFGDYAKGIAVDSSGNVCVTGASQDSGGVADYTTIKYTSAGQQQWVARYNGGDAAAIVLDSLDNIYITGSSYSSASVDYATIKYNSAGQQQWVARYDGTAAHDDGATAVAVDGSGNVYVSGYSQGSDTGNDFATIKYLQPITVPAFTPRPRPTPPQ